MARYLLPVATHTHLYHTISGLTLHRYNRPCFEFDTPLETHIVIRKMIEEVNKVDPLFMKKCEDPIPLEDTLEYQIFNQFNNSINKCKTIDFIKEFDSEFDSHYSKLIDYKYNGEKTMVQSVRSVLGLTKEKLPDDKAIDIVLNPAVNKYLSDTLTITTLSKISRSMFHSHFTFKKRISHTADSQD